MAERIPESRFANRSAVPANPIISNLNGLLADIHVRFIQIKYEDFQLYYDVFMDIFLELHETMKQVEPYYKKYSSEIKFAGSHYDRLRIKKPDEFDMDIVIGLPLDPDQKDIILEPKGAGFVQLKMSINMLNRDGTESQVNRVAYDWRDDKDYLLRSKFISWFKSMVIRALNVKGRYCVNRVPYTVRTSENGPAITLIIENTNGFKLDVDLVPALRFPETRWPICRGYRPIRKNERRGYWMVVPKPNKASGVSTYDTARSFRLALQDQEREIMYNLYNCKPTIRLLKKLKEAQQFYKIASYFIKTLFLWEIVERNDPNYWRQSPADLFKIMVKKFYNAMVTATIPYYWNPDNNLIANVRPEILHAYAVRLQELLQVLEDPSKYKLVAKYLLTTEEFNKYNSRILRL